MRFLIAVILLAFPIAEIGLLLKLGQHYGAWVWVYLIVIGFLGLRLIRDEKTLFPGRIMQSLHQGGNPIKALFGSARNIIAGVLLIIPGIITDIIAVILLLIPIQKTTPHSNTKTTYTASNDDIIEGEFRRED